MRDYGRVAPTFWTGETGKKIRKLGRDARAYESGKVAALLPGW